MKYNYLVLLIFLLFAQNIRAQQSDEQAKIMISEQAKNEVLDSLLQKLNDYYVFPEVAVKVENTIRQYKKQGYYLKITDAKTFAETLTDQLLTITHDKHLRVYYNKEEANQPTSWEAEKEKAKNIQRFKVQKNFGFTKIDILEGNIGYMKIDSFFPVNDAAQTATAVINYLANTDALIIDLRANHGGEPEMVQFLASHFFDSDPVHLNDLYWREGSRTVQYWTLPYVPAKRYLNKPVYIIIDDKTFSAGEEFTYDLQALKRATVIGKTSAGGANPGDEVKIKGQFVAFIPNGKAINPLTKTNWEGTGVKPDIENSEKDVLRETHIIALQDLVKTTSDKKLKEYFQKNLDKIQTNANSAALK
ncbi:S41 family peptidase [Chryseobacterium taichungense]|uniref:S41 family peptidase n=1 Tax=Chryseobacterium taichungense TaxID=295069 RepID=UPI0028B232B9|nr:S41 family peptidase [Chryseobacterium taichungense]